MNSLLKSPNLGHLQFFVSIALFLSISAPAYSAEVPTNPPYPIPPECTEVVTPAYTATIVKERNDRTKIYRVDHPRGGTLYFKENGRLTDYERSVFDDLKIAALTTKMAQALGLNAHLPEIQWRERLSLVIDGEMITARPGALQAEMQNLVTPIDDFKRLYPHQPVTPRGIQKVLNSGDWPRHYANWKIFWSIFHQVDLNIGNLAKMGDKTAIFDIGDALNLPAVRRDMGISRSLHEVYFNLPNQPGSRAEHRADFRLASPEFKNLAHVVATSSLEELAALMGKNLEDTLNPPRGKVRDHLTAMKNQAKRIVPLLNRGPFDY
jgi:hypothetical protein